jgi:hypothetical protein
MSIFVQGFQLIFTGLGSWLGTGVGRESYFQLHTITGVFKTQLLYTTHEYGYP